MEASAPCSALLSIDAICLHWRPSGPGCLVSSLHTGWSLFAEAARLGSLSVPACLSGLAEPEVFPLPGLFVDLSRAHKGAQGGSAWNWGLHGD